MNKLKEKFTELTPNSKIIIALICFVLAEINLLISIVLISNFVSAVNELPRESKEFAKYCNPNFFRSRNGILTMDLLLFFTILALLVLIFIQKNQYISPLNSTIIIFLSIRLIISFVFLGDPNENYISTMREGYYNNVILDPYQQENIVYKEYYDSWDTMYENEILQFFLLNIPIMVGTFIVYALKLETLPIRDQFSFSFTSEQQQQQQQQQRAQGYDQYYNYRALSPQQQQQQQFHNEGPPIAFGQPTPAQILYKNYSTPQEQQQLLQQSNQNQFFPTQQNPVFTLPKKEEADQQKQQQQTLASQQLKQKQQQEIADIFNESFSKEVQNKVDEKVQNIEFD